MPAPRDGSAPDRHGPGRTDGPAAERSAPGPARNVAADRIAGTVAGGLLLLVVLPLALLVAPPDPWPPLWRVDRAVTAGLHDVALAHGGLNSVAAVVTDAGTTWFRYVVLAPVLVWLVWRRSWRRAAFTGLAALPVGQVIYGLKDLVGRARPEVSDPGETLPSLAHPSGHSTGIAVTVGVLLVLGWPGRSRRARWAVAVSGTVVVLFVALTRLLLGVHYLTDVVSGVSLGVAWVLLLAVLLGVFRPGVPERKQMAYDRTHVR